MEDLIKKVFFAGIGSLAITYDKSRELVDQLIEKGQITVDQGRELNEELKKVIDGEEEEDLVNKFDLVTKKDLEPILDRLDRLEAKDE